MPEVFAHPRSLAANPVRLSAKPIHQPQLIVKNLLSPTPTSKAILGTGTWNQRARILLRGGASAATVSVMLHMDRRLSSFELELLQEALADHSDARNRKLVAKAIRTMGIGPKTDAALAILASAYEEDLPHHWKIEAYHDANPDAEHQDFFEITIEAIIPAADFEEVKKVLASQPSETGKRALKQAFNNDATVIEALKLDRP